MSELPVANNSVMVDSHTAKTFNRRSSQDPTSSTKKANAPRPIASQRVAQARANLRNMNLY